MPDEPQNSISEDSSPPVSPQEPTLDAPISTTPSEHVEMSPEAPESPREDVTIDVGKDPNEAINPIESQETKPEKEQEISENQASNSQTQTAQIPPNEPLDSTQDKPIFRNRFREFLAKANALIQTRKRKKLEKIMTLFLKKPQIKNDEVEKLLHVSDATATRYLSQLEKEGRIKQSGKTGKGVSYSKL